MPGRLSNATRLAWVCATALAVFVAWVATDVGANVGIGFFYAVPIGLAAWWGGGRWTVLTIACCVTLYNLGVLIQPMSDFGLRLALCLVVFVGVAILVSVVREQLSALEDSARELSALQARLTPPGPLDLPEVEAAAAFAPSGHRDSGDFYLLTNGPDGSSVAIVGDVVERNSEAPGLAMLVKARFVALIAETSDPAELLSLANAALIESLGTGRALVRAVCLRFQAENAALSWATAGHPPALRLPRLQELPPVGSTAPLGTGPDLRVRAAHSSLDIGEGLIAYTGGATDVRQGGERLGVEGLSRLVKPMVLMPPSAMASQLMGAILKWTDEPLAEDFCLFVLKPKRQS